MNNLKNLTDRELVVRLNAGCDRAFLEIYDRYKFVLTRNVLRILRSTEQTEEVLQDIFLALWEKRREIDSGQAVSAYLYRSAVNRTKNIFRQLASDRKMQESVIRSVRLEHHDVDDWIQHKEVKAVLQQLLDRLPPQQKNVYTLCKIEGLSYKEVSERLQISMTTVNSHIRNANSLLKRELLNQPHITDLLYLPILLILFS